ncbi:MAG: protein kinase [Planctomycetaceae bacterium]|nr:protein kinase [Planctomycetaceae bacterium]
MPRSVRDCSSGSDADNSFEKLKGEGERPQAGEPVAESPRAHSHGASDSGTYLAVKELLAAAVRQGAESVPAESWQGICLGEFRLLRELGRGGMGIVFEAIQISLNRRVALKILPVTSSLDASRLLRFEREARTAATLEHPHIVRAYARGQDHGTYYLAMQLIQGQDLACFIRQKRRPGGEAAQLGELAATAEYYRGEERPANEWSSEVSSSPESDVHRGNASTTNSSYFRGVARLGRQAAEALQYAHENGVVHRDIKPSNLLLNLQGDVWIADFGLATLEAASQFTATGKVLGTLRYSSPEQTRGSSEVDGRTDVYSLGATLYELATLRPAFEDSEPAAMLNAILTQEPVRPRHLVPKLPRDLESIILKAMAKSPRHRYQTALELAVDLQRFLRNEPVQAKRPTAIERSIRWVQRNRVMSFLMSAVILLLISGILGIGAHFSRQNKLLSQLDESNVSLTRALAELKQTLEYEEQLRRTVEREERMSRERYYTADLVNIARLADAGQHGIVRRRLQSHAPRPGQEDLRGFLWRYLYASGTSVDVELDAHQHEVLSTAQAPRRKLLATGGKDGTIYVWDTATWTRRTSLTFAGEVQDLEFSPDERLLAVCGTEGIIQLYGADAWRLLRTIAAHDMTAKGLEFTPNGRTLLSCSRDHDIAVWDTETWQEKSRFVAHDTVQNLSMSADGQWMASGGDDGLTKVWHVESGELAAELDDHEHAVLATALSSDGKLVAAGGYDRYVCLSDCRTGERLAMLQLNSNVWSLGFLANDSSVVIGTGSGELQIFDISNPRQPRLACMERVHDEKVRAFELLAESGQIVTVSDDTAVRVVSLPGDRFKHNSSIPHARIAKFAPDGKHFVLGQYGGEFSIYDRRGVKLASHTIPSYESEDLLEYGSPHLAFDDDATLWAATCLENTAYFTSMTSSCAIRETSIQHDCRLVKVWISSDARFVFAADTRNQGVLWELDQLSEVARFDLPLAINAAAFSNDNSRLVLATNQGEVFLTDLRGALRIQLTTPAPSSSALYAASFDPTDSLVAAAGSEGIVYVWEVASGRLIQELVNNDRVEDFAFSSNGRYLISASYDLRLWHVETGQFITQIGRRYADIRYQSVAFSSADDCLVATADHPEDEVLHIWDTTRPHTH